MGPKRMIFISVLEIKKLSTVAFFNSTLILKEEG
jgi:hypothetical protein